MKLFSTAPMCAGLVDGDRRGATCSPIPLHAADESNRSSALPNRVRKSIQPGGDSTHLCGMGEMEVQVDGRADWNHGVDSYYGME
jgi:hypothetical protein